MFQRCTKEGEEFEGTLWWRNERGHLEDSDKGAYFKRRLEGLYDELQGKKQDEFQQKHGLAKRGLGRQQSTFLQAGHQQLLPLV